MAPFNSSPESSRRAALAILAGVVVVAAIAIFLVGYLPSRHYSLVLDDMTSRLDRYRRIAAMHPQVAKNLEAMRQQDPKRLFLRTGAAALLACAVTGRQRLLGGRASTSDGCSCRPGAQEAGAPVRAHGPL